MNEVIERRLLVLATEVVQAAYCNPTLKPMVAVAVARDADASALDTIPELYANLSGMYDQEGILETTLSDETELVLLEAATRFVVAAYQNPALMLLVDGYVKQQPPPHDLSGQIHAVWVALCAQLDGEEEPLLGVHPHSRKARSQHAHPLRG